jgi:hypothetical protein
VVGFDVDNTGSNNERKDGRKNRRKPGYRPSCYVCRHPWRNLIDLEIIEDKPTGAIFSHLPVTPSIPLPTPAEINTHRRKAHMRPKDQILRDQSQKLKLLNSIIDGTPLTDQELYLNSLAQDAPSHIPPIAQPPKPARGTHPRLSQKPPEAAWSPHVLSYRQRQTGWTPEAQIALRDLQANACDICGKPNPTCFDVVETPDSQRVFGYLCQRCKGVISLIEHDRDLTERATRYLDNPPADRLACKRT